MSKKIKLSEKMGPITVDSINNLIKDAVNHPTHYNSHPAGIECIDVVEHLPFNIGNAIKYMWRADHKNNRIEDLKKAQWYISREISRLTKEDFPK